MQNVQDSAARLEASCFVFLVPEGEGGRGGGGGIVGRIVGGKYGKVACFSFVFSTSLK